MAPHYGFEQQLVTPVRLNERCGLRNYILGHRIHINLYKNNIHVFGPK